MVVQCPNCQSKFRVADEKVTERGVRVRCSNCKEVFQARKGDGGAEMKPAQPGVTGSTVEMQLFDAQALAQAKATAAARASGQRGPVTVSVSLPKGAPAGSGTAAAPPPAPAPSRTASPQTGPQSPKAAANGARRLKTGDLFGMDELTGEAAAAPGSPLSKAPPPARPEPQRSTPATSRPAASQPSATKAPAPGRAPPAASGFDALELDLGASPPPAPAAGQATSSDEDLAALLEGAAEASGGYGDAAAPPAAGEPRHPGHGDGAEALAAAPSASRPPAPRRPSAVAQARPRSARSKLAASALTGLLGAALALVVLFALAVSETGSDSVRVALGGSEDLVATRVVSGLYDTAAGQPVFFVRGRVENRGKKPRGPVRVVAELVADGGPEGRAETLAGLEPSAEEVYALRTQAEADRLSRALAQNEGNRRIPPGGSLPFFALIREPPRDLQRHRLNVHLEPVDAWTAPAQARPAPPAR